MPRPSPARRARELRHAWEQFIGGDRAGVGPRADRGLLAALARSRRRSDAAAARRRWSPTTTRPPRAGRSTRSSPCAPLIRECLAGIADDAAHLMVVSDADGTLLWLEGAPSVRLAAANSMNFAVGALWSESGAGTNAIGTALAADHAVQVFAAEHFNEVVQAWTCAAAPVHDPETGRAARDHRPHEPHEHGPPALVRGRRRDRRRGRGAPARVDARARPADPLALPRPRRGAAATPRALVMESGRVIASTAGGLDGPAERLALPALGRRVHAALGRARVRRAAGQRRRLPRAAARARAGPAAPGVLDLQPARARRPCLMLDGRALPLRRRQAEILALLCLQPQGCTTEELGDRPLRRRRVRTRSVRGEVSRLRKLGVPISSEPYRLDRPVESDVGRVQAMLRRGAVREAAEHYAGPLLALSDAPGVVRRARRAGRLAAPRGHDRRRPRGPVGVGPVARRQRRPGAHGSTRSPALDFHDPRRSQAAAQLGRLREYGA